MKIIAFKLPKFLSNIIRFLEEKTRVYIRHILLFQMPK